MLRDPHQPTMRTMRQLHRELMALLKTLTREEKAQWRDELVKWATEGPRNR